MLKVQWRDSVMRADSFLQNCDFSCQGFCCVFLLSLFEPLLTPLTSSFFHV